VREETVSIITTLNHVTEFPFSDILWYFPSYLLMISQFSQKSMQTQFSGEEMGEERAYPCKALLRLSTRWKFKSHFIKDSF
jgi:hypothetical protein